MPSTLMKGQERTKVNLNATCKNEEQGNKLRGEKANNGIKEK